VSQTELERGVSEILIEEDRLRSRVVELGEEISADYAGGRQDYLVVGNDFCTGAGTGTCEPDCCGRSGRGRNRDRDDHGARAVEFHRSSLLDGAVGA